MNMATQQTCPPVSVGDRVKIVKCAAGLAAHLGTVTWAAADSVFVLVDGHERQGLRVYTLPDVQLAGEPPILIERA